MASWFDNIISYVANGESQDSIDAQIAVADGRLREENLTDAQRLGPEWFTEVESNDARENAALIETAGDVFEDELSARAIALGKAGDGFLLGALKTVWQAVPLIVWIILALVIAWKLGLLTWLFGKARKKFTT